MGFTLIALGLGLAIALATGGRFRHLAGRSFRLWFLLPVAIALQVALEADGVPAPFALLLSSYVLLIVFGVLNLRHRGMWMVMLGFALNFAVIAVDHGMPVRPSAMRAIHAKGEIHEVKRHREKPTDKLVVLGDIIPVPPLDTVLSFGDMILAVGVMNLLYNVMRPTPGRHGADPTAPAGEPTDDVNATRWADDDDDGRDRDRAGHDRDPFGIDRLMPQTGR